jgi:hypothetical protein
VLIDQITKEVEAPRLFLMKPNREKIAELTDFSDFSITRSFNGINSLSFNIAKNNYISNDLLGGRLICLNNEEYFIIQSPQEDLDGIVEVLSIECLSQVSELGQKTLYYLNETLTIQSLVNKIHEIAPSWSLGTIDTELQTLYRTFDVAEVDLYSFIIENMQDAFECIAFFNTVNKTISFKYLDNIGTNTGLYFTEENLLNHFNRTTLTEEIITRLHVYGADSLSINSVNPVGTDYLDNFTYYRNTNWMSQSLLNALDDYDDVVATNQTVYQNLLNSLRSYESTLLIQENELSSLEVLLDTYQRAMDVEIQAEQDHSDELALVRQTELAIKNKKSSITTTQNQINNIINQINSLQNVIALDNNFTQAQINELRFVYKRSSLQR